MIVDLTRFTSFLIALIIAILSRSDADAWEATYNQKVRQPLQQLRQEIIKNSPDLPPLNQSNIEYPADEGVQLGQGWDLFLNKKVDSTCVEFKAQRDKSETAKFNYQIATDEETRDVTLNMTFSIAGGAKTGGYGDYSGNSSLTKNSFSHYYSKDVLLIGHASITNGALFAVPNTNPTPSDNGALGANLPSGGTGPQNTSEGEKPVAFKSIRLAPGLANLKRNQAEVFRSMCGDGFVSSINFGTDFYSLLTVHNVEQNIREQLETAVHTSGGYAGYTASGSGSILSIIDNKDNKQNVTMELVQNGGQIQTLPTDIATLQEKIKALPTEAWNGPKPTFIVIYPYSELSEFQGKGDEGYSTKLQLALRYNRRLQSIHSEILDMQADYEQDHTGYYFSDVHGMRSENLQHLRETVESEINKISSVIAALSDCPKGCKDDAQKKLRNKISKALGEKPEPDLPPVGIIARHLGKEKEIALGETEFDDLLYWITLPLPIKAISQKDRDIIQSKDDSVNYEQKKATYARALYRHWIQRQDAARCSLYHDCLSQTDKDRYYNVILMSFFPRQADGLIKETLNSTSEWLLTVKPCTGVLVTNRRSAQAANYFRISKKDDAGKWKVVVPEQPDGLFQPGDSNANAYIGPEVPPREQELKIETWFANGWQKEPMWNSSPHHLPSLTTELWFQDYGSNAGGPPNLAVDFTAVPRGDDPGCSSP
jgi:hypothetical protein